MSSEKIVSEMLMAFVVVFCFGLVVTGQEVTKSVVVSVDPQSQLQPGEVLIPSGEGYVIATSGAPCASCNQCCSEGCLDARHTNLRENRSATACLNCRTNGSYKYPVPRQYTYFWPGIYSQQTMTEYVAPYQGLKLRSPNEVFNGGSIVPISAE